ncbi:adenylylsulfate reductase [Flavobacterium cauense R2A-7]|uniref:Adenosine 5'-phosphosulfate reductase n=1 Tax=Flavobacterium cauense R2A-7 TaxID=1341154 RepID=V6RXB5_9FLAO|nr:phosphoadenylyl-sulfate reductase [Flavobacterium cauense]ESU19118.1 adenylylsulfate reductase [Flavobacterium cauense R2A-7]KGO82253.1 phosphoadenosine phosphosulfate reductase [Flavobacterium cauense R2A-7]TWI15210.1 phosphoadenosine phosphosulfate reductase [Flavobacterium cauense R2A-7]
METTIIKQLTDNQDIAENLKLLVENTSGKVVFSTSFGIEDQLITDLIFSNQIENIEVFTLDTGRLFQETYATWHQTELHYSQKIKSYYPENETLEQFVNEKGINPFYESTDLRKQCCNIRKVVPLQRALKGTTVWITGLRAEHSPNRNSLEIVQWDAQNQLYKYNPLLHWTTQQVKEYVNKNGIPYNILHDKGFISIGCAPCTRAIKEGDDFRAGRWWWEEASKKECGLHG